MAVVVEETAVNNEMCKNEVSPMNCLAGTSKSGLKATKLHTKNLNKLQKTINTVSYTHLTLPTKRIV